MSDDVELDYDFLVQKAYRSLMRDVLGIVAEIGEAPGNHHFYIEFKTGAPGVSIPDHLKTQYPERMTIVLQHQFEDLKIAQDGFAVKLWFKGAEASLEIPFDAVTSFADPSVQSGLRFERKAEAEKESASAAPEPSAAAAKPKTEPEGDGADIVSLDSFRKK